MKAALCFLFMIILVSYKVLEDSNKVIWSPNYKLQWQDFTGSIPSNHTSVAYISYGIDYSIKGDSVEVRSYMVKNKSWHLNEKLTEDLLKHEQYHFNLEELYARRFRKQIGKLKREEFDKEIAKTVKDAKISQDAYDELSEHSKNRMEQERWEKFIDKKLFELNDYSNTWVIILK